MNHSKIRQHSQKLVAAIEDRLRGEDGPGDAGAEGVKAFLARYGIVSRVPDSSGEEIPRHVEICLQQGRVAEKMDAMWEAEFVRSAMERYGRKIANTIRNALPDNHDRAPNAEETPYATCLSGEVHPDAARLAWEAAAKALAARGLALGIAPQVMEESFRSAIRPEARWSATRRPAEGVVAAR